MVKEMKTSICNYVLNNIERVSPFLLKDKYYGFEDVDTMLENIKNDDNVTMWAYYHILFHYQSKEYMYKLLTSILWKK